jgi:phage baseplate assembly protein W
MNYDEKYRGISFPFRIGVRGGVVMSSASWDSPRHIVESINQILNTFYGERVMEYHINSDLDTGVFSPNDESTHSLLEYQIRKALERLEPRISVESIQIQSEKEKIEVTIYFKTSFQDSVFSTSVNLGG